MMRLCTAILLFFSISLNAQFLDEERWKDFKPRAIGPAGMSGRVTTIDVLRNQPEVIYVGTASGGLWRSENGGVNWDPIFDGQKVLSIGAVAVQQGNPDVIWAGTGEGNPRNSYTSGHGIYKSIDGGENWTLMGLEETKTIHRIIIHRDNPDIVFVAAMGSAWGANKERGVYKTTDGGKTWERVLYNNDLTGCADLVTDPANPNKLIAAMWEYRRWPWFFTSGGKGSGLYISHDAGETWEKRTEKDGLPKGELGRIGLALCHSNPDVIYALVESKKTALYKSENGGFDWKKISDKNIGNRPFYYADIYCNPKNENELYNLYSFLSKSEDGGKSFRVIMPYHGYHPDHHAFYMHPDDPDYIINGNDGGLNISRDGGKTWRFVENLPVAQFYHINVDNDIPYNIYGGMQDNGSWMGPAYVWRSDGIRNSYWEEVMFGDGFDVMPDPENNRYGYAMYQGGNVSRYDRLTGQDEKIQPVHPEGEALRFNWNAPIALDPHDSCGLYFGSQFLHYSADKGKSWQILSPDLTTDDPEKQKQAESGGLTIDATRAENYTTVLSIAPSPLDANVIWVGTDDGNLQFTANRGETWTKLNSRLKGVPENAWIPQIVASEHNKEEAFVVVNNYRQNDWKPYLYYTDDMGKSWKNLVDEESVFGYCLSVIQDTENENLLFLGTEHGLYFSFNKGETWQKWWDNYPSVSTMDLKIQRREADLVAGTFGRAAYVFDDIRPLREMARNGDQVKDRGLHLFQTPTAYLAHNNTARGIRFAADAVFKGENRQRGAMISFWWNGNSNNTESADSTGRKKSKKKEKLHFTVFSENKDTIRNYSFKADTGFNQITWGLRRNGIRYPSYHTPKEDSDPPPGASVVPGKYLVRLNAGDLMDSVWIEVKPDPRIAFSPSAAEKRELLLAEYYKILKAATGAVQNLNDAKKRISKVNDNLEFVEDSLKKKIKKSGKTLNDSIKTLHELFLTPRDFEGYDHVTRRINDKLGETATYITGPVDGPGPQSEVMLDLLEEEVTAALKRINRLLTEDWQAYMELVEQSDPKFFKPYEPVILRGDE